jgi:hypothetical protein
VESDTGVTIENLVLDRFGTMRVNSWLCRGPCRLPMYLKAKLLVFAGDLSAITASSHTHFSADKRAPTGS